MILSLTLLVLFDYLTSSMAFSQRSILLSPSNPFGLNSFLILLMANLTNRLTSLVTTAFVLIVLCVAANVILSTQLHIVSMCLPSTMGPIYVYFEVIASHA